MKKSIAMLLLVLAIIIGGIAGPAALIGVVYVMATRPDILVGILVVIILGLAGGSAASLIMVVFIKMWPKHFHFINSTSDKGIKIKD